MKTTLSMRLLNMEKENMNQMLFGSMFKKKNDESSIYRSSPLMNEPRISFPPCIVLLQLKKRTLPSIPKH